MTTRTRRKAADVWTEARIRSYGVRMPSKEAYKALTGCSDRKAYDLLRSGADLGVRVFHVGRERTTPVADVLKVLGLDQEGVKAAEVA